MIFSPIIPIWIMIIVCVILIIVILKNKSNLIRRLVIIALLFIINLRIMIPSSKGEGFTNNIDVLFVIDNTISMIAEDYNKNKPRFDGVKEDCKYIIDELAGAKFSVITFNDTSQILIPYTRDVNMVVDTIEMIKVTDSYYARGSDINIALDDMSKILKSSKEGRTSIVFFISDGEITNDKKLKSFSNVKKYIDNGAVLGYGTQDGGYMKNKSIYYDEEFDKEYIEDKTDMSVYPYPKAVSKIDEDNLKQISNDMKIDYINMSKQSNIKSKIKEIKKEIFNAKDIEDLNNGSIDIYFIFSFVLLLLLIFEFINYKKKL